MIDSQGEKLKKYLSGFDIIDANGKRNASFKEIAELLDVSRNTLYSYFTSQKLSGKVIANIENKLGVNLKSVLDDNVVNSDQGVTRSEFLLRSDNRSPMQKVPLYDIQASAGLVQLFQSDKQTPIDWISIPNLPKSDGAIYVTGDSMYPLLKSGDIVIFKNVNDVREGLFWGEMYIVAVDIDGDEMTTVKYIQKSELGSEYIKLVSQNQNHAPKDIKLEHLKAAALVKASIRMNTII